MFTGIISDLGRVRAIERRGADARVVIETGYDTGTIDMGASIACSGPCLTVVGKDRGWFAVDVSAETLRLTTIGEWAVGRRINLERALRLGDELGGHLVSGHVDGIAELVGAEPEGEGMRLEVAVPQPLARYVATKGSVALDGVSLTVNWVDGARFGVMIIPHTQRMTTLGEAGKGTRMNLEIDLLARYVERLRGSE
ncbi:MAG: riboflavin synthase [Alphaproteobacteria bacterium]|nr:riboflavin synthase [Alphaproteobacteria bacterium]